MVDVFEEVESDLRSERYQALFRRLMPWAIAGIAAGVVAVAGLYGYQAYRDSIANNASDAYAEGLKALQTGDAEAAFKHFNDVPVAAQ